MINTYKNELFSFGVGLATGLANHYLGSPPSVSILSGGSVATITYLFSRNTPLSEGLGSTELPVAASIENAVEITAETMEDTVEAISDPRVIVAQQRVRETGEDADYVRNQILPSILNRPNPPEFPLQNPQNVTDRDLVQVHNYTRIQRNNEAKRLQNVIEFNQQQEEFEILPELTRNQKMILYRFEIEALTSEREEVLHRLAYEDFSENPVEQRFIRRLLVQLQKSLEEAKDNLREMEETPAPAE